ELRKITDLDRQGSGFHLPPRLLCLVSIVCIHRDGVVVGFPGLWRHIPKPFLGPALSHDCDSLVERRGRLPARVFEGWKRLYGHAGDLNDSTDHVWILGCEILRGQRARKSMDDKYRLVEPLSSDKVSNVALQPPCPRKFSIAC